MPRDGSGHYFLPPGTYGIPQQPVLSTPYNAFADDLAADLNAPRPISAGGTGGTDKTSALAALGAEGAGQQIVNYDTSTFVAGSFWSDASAAGGPISGHQFFGTTTIYDINNIMLRARDVATGGEFQRVKFGGIWQGWTNSIATPTKCGGLLSRVDTTHLKFAPYDGDQIKINGAWYTIPSSGIIVTAPNATINGAPGTLAPATTYYVYAWMKPGAVGTWPTLDLDFSATGHATSTAFGNAGNEIKNGDDTRTLVGLVRFSAVSTFLDDPTQRLVRSWYNRQRQDLSLFTVATDTFATTSTGGVFMPISLTFYTWAGESININFQAIAYTLIANNLMGFFISLDGAPVTGTGLLIYDAHSNWTNVSFGQAFTLTNENQHTIQILVSASGGSTTNVGRPVASGPPFASISGQINK